MGNVKVFWEDEEQWIDCSNEDSLLEALLKREVPINHVCEGMASCGTCRIIVSQGLEQLPERNPLETDMAEDRQFRPEERLACQLCPTHHLRFRLPTD